MTFSNETSFPLCITALHSEMSIEMSIVYYCSANSFFNIGMEDWNEFTETKQSKIYLAKQFRDGPLPKFSLKFKAMAQHFSMRLLSVKTPPGYVMKTCLGFHWRLEENLLQNLLTTNKPK